MRHIWHETPPIPLARRTAWMTCLQFIAFIFIACAPAAMQISNPSPLTNTSTAASPFLSIPTLAPQIPEQRLLIVEWPQTIRVGDRDLIFLSLEVDPQGNITPIVSIQGQQSQGANIAIPNLYETHHVFAEGRLEINGLKIQPNSEIRTPLHLGKRVTFAWSVRPEQSGNFRGMVWLHLVFKPRGGGGGEEKRLTLFVQRIDIRAVNFLGLSGVTARWMGILGTLLGLYLSFDSIRALFGKLWKRRQSPNQIPEHGE